MAGDEVLWRLVAKVTVQCYHARKSHEDISEPGEGEAGLTRNRTASAGKAEKKVLRNGDNQRLRVR